MAGHRIHIFGASGAGTSTLGRALATVLASQHFDVDDFYWRPTDPPFRAKRSIPERRALMEAVFLPRRDWVLSGSVDSWSEGIDDRFTLAIFLDLDIETRLARLRAREALRLKGASRDAAEEMAAFLEWAAAYDDGLLPGRNRARHETWASELACPVLRLNSAPPVEVLVGRVLASLDAGRQLA
ncbi:Adenylate kinase [Tropicimonas isoalkanivorans]|uniref:Adenylate kinase n=1 Tax=Tropicimonas isoalkanivorans TaxID=441112 RepID=A0A1I1NFP0_9RHOB|nr:Adenylate kinase [Tropicimonas isoalkanivorans]